MSYLWQLWLDNQNVYRDSTLTFKHGLNGDRLFGYLNVHLEDFPIRTL